MLVFRLQNEALGINVNPTILGISVTKTSVIMSSSAIFFCGTPDSIQGTEWYCSSDE